MARALRAWPTSYRGRIALAAVIALAVGVGLQAAVRGVSNERVRDAAEDTLQAQAVAIAEEVEAARDDLKRDRAADAARYLPDTRIRVTWPEPGGLYFNLVSVDGRSLSASASVGGVDVELEQASPTAGLADWVLVALFVLGALLTGVIVWVAASALARRLRSQAADLAASAAAVAGGDLTARAEVTEDELGRAAGAFNEMAARLAEADERQRRFIADIAHELRTPVTAIDGFAEALVDGAASTPDARAEAVTVIRDEAARLRELVDDLRGLTAVDARATPRIAPVDLAALAHETVARLGPVAAEAEVALVVPAASATVHSDERHLEAILTNLVRNAVTATPAGGRVEVRAGRRGDHGWLEVTDTGVGIPAEHLPRIFDRLYRIDTARSRDRGGSGLGLAIVKDLAEGVLGGSVHVRSAPGEGATFTVQFPAEPVAEPAGVSESDQKEQ